MQNFTPSCPQYTQNSGALVKVNPQVTMGNCSANNLSGRPQDPPYDFVCASIGPAGSTQSQLCINLANGNTGPSPNSICCGGAAPTSFPTSFAPSVFVQRPTLIPQYASVNDCALHLDRLQNLPPNDSAGHFRNMTICRNLMQQ